MHGSYGKKVGEDMQNLMNLFEEKEKQKNEPHPEASGLP